MGNKYKLILHGKSETGTSWKAAKQGEDATP